MFYVGLESHGGEKGNKIKQESGLVRLILPTMPTLEEYCRVSVESCPFGAHNVSLVAVWGSSDMYKCLTISSSQSPSRQLSICI